MTASRSSPTIIPRPEHILSRANVSDNALKVLSRLKQAGYAAYLVGGCVRDLLIGRRPKDFDVTTDAHPDEVHALFRNSRLIGRRFRIVHVCYGRETIEVATFRAEGKGNGKQGKHRDREVRGGMLVKDNVFGTMDEDAWRRDFTVNALYYNIRDFSVVDYMQGLKDLEAGVLHMIGDPEVRYREDPVRLLRAVRFAAKLNFSIHPETERPMFVLGRLLHDVAPARLFEEILKLFMSGYGEKVFYLLEHYGLFSPLFPQSRLNLTSESEAIKSKASHARQFFIQALKNTDARIAEGKPVTPAFLIATALWEPVSRGIQALMQRGEKEYMACRISADKTLLLQTAVISLPRRFSSMAREIWAMQPRFMKRKGKRTLVFLTHVRFRAAYDFMCLRCQSGDTRLQEAVDWWTKIQQVAMSEKCAMAGVSEASMASLAAIIAEKQVKPAPRKKRRRRYAKKPSVDIPNDVAQ